MIIRKITTKYVLKVLIDIHSFIQRNYNYKYGIRVSIKMNYYYK